MENCLPHRSRLTLGVSSVKRFLIFTVRSIRNYDDGSVGRVADYRSNVSGSSHRHDETFTSVAESRQLSVISEKKDQDTDG